MSDHPAEHPYDPNRFPHFESPWITPRLDDVMYAVSCDTRATHYLIIIARKEFLSCWLSDTRMLPRLEGWRDSVGLPAIVDDVADFLDRVAERLGVPRRADLGRIPCTPQALFEDFIPEWCRLQDRLYTAYRRGGEVMNATEAYVCDELQQPWPWLVGQLTHYVFQQAWEQAMGITMVHQRTSPLDPMWELLDRVQPFRSVFQTRSGETVAQAKRRRMAEAREDCKELKSIENSQSWWDLPRGSPRKNQQENARQDARWLYRQLLCGDIPYQMALAWHHERKKSGQHAQDFSASCGCEQRVYRGIQKSRALLNSTPYEFSDTDK
jgi:hypothetical protein